MHYLKEFNCGIKMIFFQACLCFCTCQNELLAQTGKIAPFPQELTVQAGETFKVTWWVNPGDSPVAAVDFILWYDKNTIKPLTIENVDSPLNINQIKPSIDTLQGRIVYAAFKLSSPWPENPFPLMTIQLQALDSSGLTTLHHDMDITPNTSMAFEGRYTLKEAHDLKVRILSDEQVTFSSSSSSTPGFQPPSINLDEETGYYTYHYNSDTAGNVQISIKGEDDTLPDIFWQTRVNPGQDFRYVLNPHVFPSGRYTLNMQSADGIKLEKEVSF
jgi:hypothetical protein